MKFGKTLLSQQLPEYSVHYINYKALKKVIKSLAAGSENETLLDENGVSQTRIQENKATFFFKLERELDKVNCFYLQKEAGLRNRLETLLDKKRFLQTGNSLELRSSANFIILQEGFQQFERDLNKLQQYVELNATGFYKALKKWDKRSKSHTKELYLSRRVEIQPVFNRDILSELVDTATSILLELEAHANGEVMMSTADSKKSPDLRAVTVHAEDEVDSEILKAVLSSTEEGSLSDILARLMGNNSGYVNIRLTRILMQAMSGADVRALTTVVSTDAIDFTYEDEISGRLCIHEAVLSGRVEVVNLCLSAKSDLAKTDVYGRTPLHYACMQNTDSHLILVSLLQNNAPVNVLDHNLSSPLHYAILNGNIGYVQLLLHYGAEVNPKSESDYIPLSMACARGHLDLAELLLKHGAKILYNSEGLLPIHLVARAGHKGLCTLLLRHNIDVEARDKFSGWTPMFFAASEGHVEIIKELIECKALVDVRDDEHHSPTYYAAWEGHKAALQTLLNAGGGFGNTESILKRPSMSQALDMRPNSDLDAEDDGIPSLLLPPPILPVRSYGHNYLDKMIFVQITLTDAHNTGKGSPVEWYLDETLFSSSKLTVSLKSTNRKHTSELIPHTVSLPILDDSESFTFQVDTLDSLSLELEIYPTFGSKVIAKGVAAPEVFDDVRRSRANGGRVVVPLLDPRLQCIGKVSFEYTIIRPFSGIQFDIHSRIETYWKSTQTIAVGAVGAQHLVTESSLSGDYVWVPVQVCRDNVAFVCPAWYVPVPSIKLGAMEIDSVALESIPAIAEHKETLQRDLTDAKSAAELQVLIKQSFIRLSEFLSLIRGNIKLHLQIIQPTVSEQQYLKIRTVTDENTIVDTILSTVFGHAEEMKLSHEDKQPRSILFSSSNTTLCTALNWKQPNYPVFLALHLGPAQIRLRSSDNLHDSSPHGLAVSDNDPRCSSIKQAVKFSKVNNLLGVVVDAEVAIHAPALITTIKESGLVLVTHGAMNSQTTNVERQSAHGVDGIQVDGVCRFLTQIDM